MSESTIFDLTTVVNLEPLTTGMTQAVASVQSAAASIAASLMKDGESADAAASALKNLGYAASEVKAALASSNVNIGESVIAEDALASATRSGISERMAASASLRVLEGNLQGSSRAAGAFLASTLGLGPALQAAFPVIGALALFGILEQIGTKIGEMIDKPEKIRLEWEKVGSSMIDENDRLAKSYDHVLVKVTELESGKLAGLDEQIKLLAIDTSSLGGTLEHFADSISKVVKEEGPWYEWLRNGTITLMEAQAATRGESADLELLRSNFGAVSKEAIAFGAALHRTLSTEGTSAGLKQVDEQLTTVYTRLQTSPNDEALKKFRDGLEQIQSMLSKEASTKYLDSVKDGLERDKTAAEEFDKQMKVVQKGLDALTKSTGEVLTKGGPQTAGVGSEGTDIAKLTAEQNAQMSKLLDERIALEQKAAEQGAAVDKKAADESIGQAIRTEQGYEASLRGQERTAQESYSLQIDGLVKLAERKEITWTEESAKVVALYREEEAALQASLDKQIAAAVVAAQLEAAKRGEILSTEDARELASVQKLEQEKLTLHEQFLRKEQDAEAKAAEKVEQTYRQNFDRIANTLNTSIASMLNGHETFAQGVMKVWESITTMAIDAILKMAENWVFHHVIMAAANTLFHTQTTANEIAAAAAHAATMATNSAENVAMATSDAAVAAAGTLAWWSAVFAPAAPAMAATALTEGLAFAGLAAFAKGGIVPEDMVGQLHGGEMVLPPELSTGVQNMVSHGGPRGLDGESGRDGQDRGGGDSHFHYHVSIQALDTNGIESVLMENKGAVGKVMERLVSNGHFNVRDFWR